MNKKLNLLKQRIIKLSAILMTMAIMQSCFTGVEGTQKITLSKKDIHITAPTEEERYLDDMQPSPLREWKQGKRFLVTDEKFQLVVERNSSNPVAKGDTITYVGIEKRQSPGGEESSAIVFDSSAGKLTYPIDKTPERASDEITSLQLPMMIELDMVENVKRKLHGNELWTRSALWYDEEMKYQKGGKYVRVLIEDVEPGNTFFPLLVKFKDDEGTTGSYLMNIGNSGTDSRSFSRLFYLSDPRNNYKHISDENWAAIQKEEVRLGMTKEECRLSKGNPMDTNSGHSYSSTMEIWKYSDGTILRFVDGQLISF